MYKRPVGIGVLAGLVSCSCIIIPIFLIIFAGSNFYISSQFRNYDTLFIIIGAAFLAIVLIYDLKRKNALNPAGIKKNKKSIYTSIFIFIVTDFIILIISFFLMGFD